ncbi:helix-turn-helix domain-containing protein [Gabonibacter chumensis]|uniref:helix-turn-helix domain-containing protein n=1 Tax=Gabonibacter chumensis TaxID=2972474 RepID=UPI002572DEF9|nr:AraC family transcriptional regulator [Gabonibacter chumensis]MCR9011852.1 AraC family transcriptional regulator [Gabonibacter chumensis]
MKKEIVKIDTIHQCNTYFGKKTLHPLASVIDFSKANEKRQVLLQFSFYSVWLKEYKCNYSGYGRKFCDYSDGTLLFLSPGVLVDTEKNHEMPCSNGYLLTFHPDLIKGTFLEEHMKDYTFFFYQQDEALHLSSREKRIIHTCLERINEEIHHSIDNYSNVLITTKIELLLNHCVRFYDRQFITRHKANENLIKKTKQILNHYFTSGQIGSRGMISSSYCAVLLHLSTAYFEDLLKHESGKTIHEYIQLKRIEMAKKQLSKTNKTIVQISEELGFSSSLCFNRLFKKLTGHGPNEYRSKY